MTMKLLTNIKFTFKTVILFSVLTCLSPLNDIMAQVSIMSMPCQCNNDQTPNMTNGTYLTTLVIKDAAGPLPAGQTYTVISSVGLLNTMNGALGNASFTYCGGVGCPSGVTMGQYYLNVHVSWSNSYSAMVDGPDADILPELTLATTTCTPTYPALPAIPMMDSICINADVSFSANGGLYNKTNVMMPVTLPTGFSQAGVGAPLLIDYETFNPTDNPYRLYLIAKDASGTCRVSSYSEFGILKEPIALIDNKLYDCVSVGGTISLFQMVPVTSSSAGKFYIGGTEVVNGQYTVTGPICQTVTYRIDDPVCGIKESMGTFQVTTSPAPAFNLSSASPSPVCQVGGSVTVTGVRSSTGSNPIYTITSNRPAYTGTVAGSTFTLPAPSSTDNVTYTICLSETNNAPPACPGVVLPPGYTPCTKQTCKQFVVYNDGYACGAANLFSDQCVGFDPDPCYFKVEPRLQLMCGALFTLSIPVDIVTTTINLDNSIIRCNDNQVCGNINASFFNINGSIANSGPKIRDLPIPGISVLCGIFCFCIPIVDICPLQDLCNLLGCDRTFIQFILDLIATLAGGDGGGYILVADTDGDGYYDKQIREGGFPHSGSFCVPNNVKGKGEINIRLVAGWPFKPKDVCGDVTSKGPNLLDLLPIGAIPIVGAVIEDVIAALQCNIDLSWSNVGDARVDVINRDPAIFQNCNTNGYIFQQTGNCNIPVNWSIPVAISSCDNKPLIYRGRTSGVNMSFYTGPTPPPAVIINREGIYQTAGPFPGSVLPVGSYVVTYTAVGCNGNPAQCSFPVIVRTTALPLLCPPNITLNTDVDQCTAFINGLSPIQGLGACNSILNYTYTDPISGTIHTTTSTTPGTINIPSGYFELGVTTITYTLLTDINGDGDYLDPGETQTCSFTITVLDKQFPHAVCLSTSVKLDNNGSATIYADELIGQVFVDGGSTDNCDDIQITISKDGTTWSESLTFDCSEEFNNIIRLRVIDGSGNESFCLANIEVIDFFDGFALNLDVPEVCFEPFQDTFDFSPYVTIVNSLGRNYTHNNVGTIGPNVVGNFGISLFVPDPGSTSDPGTITPDGLYTIGTGTGWITISYVLSIGSQTNNSDNNPLVGCYRIVHDVFRVQKLYPEWKGGYMCCDQQPVWLGGANWLGVGNPIIPAGMLSLRDIRGDYPKDAYGEWKGQGVTFVDPDGVKYSGDEFYQFDPTGLDGSITITYIVGDEPCEFEYSQEILVTCQDLHVDISDYTVCPANWVEEKQVLTNLDDDDIVVSTTGFDAMGAAGAVYANGVPVEDLQDVLVIDGRVVIPGFFAPVLRNQTFEICVTTYQTTPFGCTDNFCYNISVVDTTAPVFHNLPRDPVVVDAPAGWCNSFVNFEYPWANDDCMGLYSRIEQVDLTGLKSGDLFPVGLTILSYTATDTVGNQSYAELKVIVNDFHTPPTIVCKPSVAQVNDADMCGAVVDNIEPVSVEDNCINNVSILYEILDSTNKPISCGFEDASGFKFPVGTNKVTYNVYDQPLILITEIVQNGIITGVEITNFGPAAVDITCGKFLLKNAAGTVLDSFIVPTRNNKSTYGRLPIYPPDPVMWVLPNPNIVPVGGTFTHNFTLNQAIGANRKYCFKFLDRLIDEAQINDQVVGEVILRKNVCDHNVQSDFIPATPCDPGSYGMLNPGLPTMTPNGTTVGLQNIAPSNDVCSFEVKISDVEDPSCIKHDSVLVASTNVPLAINANACLVSKVTMPAGLVHDVNIRNLVATITNAGAVTAYLNSPSGTRIKLFDNVCPSQPNINVNLDQTIVWTPAPSITTALCNPLGRGGTYAPEESFKAFYGEQAAGDWYLEIFTQGAVTGTLNSWSLQILYQLPYDQPDVVLNNIPGICTQQYSWIHPILEDNCCAGTVNVSYTFENSVTGERSIENGVISNKSGTINFQGLRITKTFKVGKTTIEYTLVDQYGNTSKCSFMVTVNDNEVPVFTAGCPDRVINLLPGECLGELVNPPTAGDNCSDVTVTFCFENGNPADIYNLPIGSYVLIAKGVDIYGNLQTCRFLVTVAEYIPSSSDLTCNDVINLSLDSTCTAVLNADMILEGGKYGCYNNYIIKITDYNNVPHALSFSYNDVGHCFKVTIIDPRSGNSCWGKVCVEDKQIPIIECVRDTILSCIADPDPIYIGRPRLLSCEVGGVTWNYHDEVLNYNECDEFVAEIRRIWTVTDVQGNFDTCLQIIKFRKFDLASIVFPRNYDDLDLAHLECSDVRTAKDISAHLVAPPSANWECVDGYLLDSAIFKSRVALGADPRYYIQDPFNFGARSPRQLGWNYLESGKYAGNPSPYHYYYNQHPQWNPNQACWPGDRHVMWQGTGFPIIDGYDISNRGLCAVSIKYDDDVYTICENGYEILRYWKIRNMCLPVISGVNPIEHIQVIKVLDKKGPTIVYPDSIIVTSSPWSCSADWVVPSPWFNDNCSDTVTYTVRTWAGTPRRLINGGWVVNNLPKGNHNVEIAAKDNCGNTTVKKLVATVIDGIPPVALCSRNTVATLGNNQSTGEGIVKVYAKDLDEGSHDNCSPHVFFKVIRMEELINTRNGRRPPFDNRISCNGLNGDDDPSVNSPGNQVYFDDFTKFCCADAGKTVMVVLRVFDKDPGAGPIHPNRFENIFDLEGHFNDCMVEVEIQDKQPPSIIAPPDMVVSCWYWFDPSEAALEDPNNNAFGRVVTDLSDRKKVATLDLVCHQYCETNIHDYPGGRRGRLPLTARNEGDIACDYYWSLFDTAHLDRKYELAWGFDGYAVGTCAVTPTINASDNRDCGQGLITRTFSVAPGISAVQQIWVVDCDPFWVATACDQLDDIFWPDCQQLGSSVIGCGARDWSPNNPNTGGWAKVEHGGDDNCALIAIEYKDEFFTVEPDACIKIIRTWTVLDWCQYDPFDPNWKGSGRWTHTHVIKVRDEDAPVVTCTVGLCETQGLATIDPATGLCVNHITLTATAYDSCSPEDWLKWEYKIDAFNDGKGVHSGYDFRVGSLTKKEFAAGDTALVNHNPYADDNKNPFDASGTYPVGVHKIKWFVEDGCGNIAVCESLFEVKDCKKPTPYCLTGVITVPMPSSGCVEVWATDLNLGSYDNCTPKNRLKFYFDGDTSLRSRTFCCDDFVAAGAGDELNVEVEMWVEDEEGNTDFCKTTIIIQDVNDICPNTSNFGKITGDIKTLKAESTKLVNMQLLKNNIVVKEAKASPYYFLDLGMSTEYVVQPSRNDNHLNGVTTGDIVKIQKHILGQQLITNPYLLIAADVNNNGSITAADISIIRKLILGIIPEFKSVPSWTFIPKNYVFVNPDEPWLAPRNASVMLNEKIKVVDFVSIKMGDINETASSGLGSVVETRNSEKPLNFNAKDVELVAGETYRINFNASDFTDIMGYQFTLEFDQEAILYQGFEAAALPLTEANFGLNKVGEGIITTSWNSNSAMSVEAHDKLFYLIIRANKNTSLSKVLKLGDGITRAEAYHSDLTPFEVKLNVTNESNQNAEFALYQNEPNPFKKEAMISFNLPKAMPSSLTIYDQNGKVVRIYEIDGVKGLNNILINKQDLNGAGNVLYYQLDALEFTATKRMVLVD